MRLASLPGQPYPLIQEEADQVKAVFTHKLGSIYDDLPEERYHFPATYRRQVEEAVGDFIVYYEPRRGGSENDGYRGRQAYVATARVVDIRPDPQRPDHFYAAIQDYIPFPNPVPFREGGQYRERFLVRADGATSKGAFGRAVRALPEVEYEAIVAAGFGADLLIAGAPAEPGYRGLEEPPALFQRPVVEQLTNRLFRDRVFAKSVQTAYAETCAFTDLRIVNGGGRTEAEAAHIRPVAAQGPDSVRNGIALSGTVHWMFDRGLVSIAPDHSILVARSGVPEAALRWFRPDRRIRLPCDPRQWPHPAFLEWHRQQVFKG
ncbi:HNH endonuclease [Geminicoccus sp.]|uniref:HNH endonuclease n=1 Tax=Geminicoccus sp. TaxID=2024832 RepID=UPI002D80D85E|nr:HNH endonuclease [Geminicoccus sp.]